MSSTNEIGNLEFLERLCHEVGIRAPHVDGRIEMPARQTGSPMSYMHDGNQYIVLAVSHAGADAGGELIAFSLP
jgi:hypothetical protein